MQENNLRVSADPGVNEILVSFQQGLRRLRGKEIFKPTKVCGDLREN
jgi:hypothetical protein